MDLEKVTEEESRYHDLEKMTIHEILTDINREDKTVPEAVEKAIPQMEQLVAAITDKMLAGGRLFYIGAGTSGRLGVLDASEIPPTYGLPFDLVIGIIAGGETAIRRPVENAEDDGEQGWQDLEQYAVSDKDIVVGIAASGTTPYVDGCACRMPEKGYPDRLYRLQSGSPGGGGGGLSRRGGGRPGVCHGEHANEERHGAKAGVEYVVYGGDDPDRAGGGQ